jgi:hypothetical protein
VTCRPTKSPGRWARPFAYRGVSTDESFRLWFVGCNLGNVRSANHSRVKVGAGPAAKIVGRQFLRTSSTRPASLEWAIRSSQSASIPCFVVCKFRYAFLPDELEIELEELHANIKNRCLNNFSDTQKASTDPSLPCRGLSLGV